MSVAASTARALAGWEAGGAEPLPERLTGALERALLDGRIAPETRLPSERELAAALGVSRSTVSHAYGLLRAGGWLTTRHGAGSVARLPQEFRHGLAPTDGAHPDGAIDLRRASPAAPMGVYRDAMRRAVDAITPELAQSFSTQGLPALRRRIAERHSARGVPTTPEQILVTSGAMPGLWVILAALLRRAPSLLVEAPTYPGALEAARQRRARLVPWPVVDGWDVGAFERLARGHGVAAAYVVPDFHNPTGRLGTPAMREELRDAAQRLGVRLVVDETMAEIDLREDPEPIAPLAGPGILTLGSLSKTVWDGLRVGWIRGEAEVVGTLAAHPLAAQVASPPLEQAIAAEMLPALDEVLDARRRALRARRDRLVAALGATDGIRVDRPPAGGLSVWATLERASSARLAIAAVERGVLLHPGGRFSPTGGLDANVRLPYSLPVPLLDAALDRLRDLL
jgi:DNA-binding transcriptional MocR family regulator